jgi:hypothetical protein
MSETFSENVISSHFYLRCCRGKTPLGGGRTEITLKTRQRDIVQEAVRSMNKLAGLEETNYPLVQVSAHDSFLLSSSSPRRFPSRVSFPIRSV